ncbi:MAG: HEAT repeat domain-containing protein [Candidatus Thorarchaeota archaeon]
MTKSISVLMRNLYDANPEVRGRAAMDLGENLAIDAVSSLTKVMLTDEEPNVRSLSAEALGTIAEASSLPDLVKALNSETEDRVLSTINWAIDATARKLGISRDEAISEYSTKRSGIIDRISKSSDDETSTSDVEEDPDYGICSAKNCNLKATNLFEVEVNELILITHLCSKHFQEAKKS